MTNVKPNREARPRLMPNDLREKSGQQKPPSIFDFFVPRPYLDLAVCGVIGQAPVKRLTDPLLAPMSWTAAGTVGAGLGIACTAYNRRCGGYANQTLATRTWIKNAAIGAIAVSLEVYLSGFKGSPKGTVGLLAATGATVGNSLLGSVLTTLAVLAIAPQKTSVSRTTPSFSEAISDQPLDVCLYAPLLEELMFRRGLLQVAAFCGGAFENPVALLLLCAIVFGVPHANNNHEMSTSHAIIAGATGVSFARAYARYGLVGSFAAHAAQNAACYGAKLLLEIAERVIKES